MELKQMDLRLFKTLYLIEAGIIVTQVMNMDSLTSLLFLLTFPITVLLWLRSVRRTAASTDVIMGFTAALAVICVFINMSLCGGSLGFQYLKKLIMFVMTLLLFQTAHRTRPGKELTGFVNLVVDLVTLFLIAMFLTQGSKMFVINGRVTIFLTFRFSNANMIALLLSCLFMTEVNRLFTPEKWYVKAYHLVLILFLAWFVMLTRSRNCALAMLLYSVISVWLMFSRKKEMTIKKFWAMVVAVFPGVFVLLYSALVTNPWVQEVFSFLVAEGKKLSSRMAVWGPALKEVWDSPIVGAYYQISDGAGKSQMHNNHLDIAASYGIPVLILVCVLLTCYIHHRGRRYTQKGSFICMIAFCCAILLGIGEAAVFAGGMGIYIFVGTFLLMANMEEESL
jgi:hypothetical protein